MIAVISDRLCPPCGRRHTLCLADVDHFEHEEYEYKCPVTNRTVRFAVGRNDWDLFDVTCPSDHVLAVRVSP
jgi:hypothetical protein